MTVNLNDHINQNHAADIDFETMRVPLYVMPEDGGMAMLQDRQAIVRRDRPTVPLGIVSERYGLVEHRDLIRVIDDAVAGLNVGESPRGVYLSRIGARMDALYKFPALSQDLVPGDTLCPCVKVSNSYDTGTRIMVGIGAYRFVCTNLAVGGTGVFASGFISVHYRNVNVEAVGSELRRFLDRFADIMATYRLWMQDGASATTVRDALEKHRVPMRHIDAICPPEAEYASIWEHYNSATGHATRNVKSAYRALVLLAAINICFQRTFGVAKAF